MNHAYLNIVILIACFCLITNLKALDNMIKMKKSLFFPGIIFEIFIKILSLDTPHADVVIEL